MSVLRSLHDFCTPTELCECEPRERSGQPLCAGTSTPGPADGAEADAVGEGRQAAEGAPPKMTASPRPPSSQLSLTSHKQQRVCGSETIASERPDRKRAPNRGREATRGTSTRDGGRPGAGGSYGT